MNEKSGFKDKQPQIDRVLSQLKQLSELSEEELETKIQELTNKDDEK